LPTILEITGIRVSEDVDGISFLSALTGDYSSRQNPVYWHYPHYGNQGGSPGATMRSGNFKLIEFFEEAFIHICKLIVRIYLTYSLHYFN